MLTFEQIKELIELVDERGLSGLEIERSGFRLKIEGHGTAAVVPMVEPVVAVAPAPTGRAPSEESPGSVVESESVLPDDAHVVNSPIVGTFYASASPDSSPYVRVGDRVEAGQVLCIVEAMKLMNEIESDAGGVILEIYPKNAQAVEFGEPLFAIASA